MVNAYTADLLATVYPSFIDALPTGARAPVLDTISALQYRLAEYIAAMLKSEETAAAIARFVDRQIDQLLARRIDATLSDDALDQISGFVEERFQNLVSEEVFKRKVREFIWGRLDDLAGAMPRSRIPSLPKPLLSSKSAWINKSRPSSIILPILLPARTLDNRWAR